jgi:hypothetical protein
VEGKSQNNGGEWEQRKCKEKRAIAKKIRFHLCLGNESVAYNLLENIETWK